MTPVISILMPVLNCETTIRLAVQSIVDQTFTDWELLVIDDGSTDGSKLTTKGLRDPRVFWIADNAGRRGLAARLNQGIGLARGPYIARMDGDDVSFPRRLQTQLDFLEKNPSVDLVGCGMIVFKNEGEIIGQQNARENHADICGSALRSCLLPHATWLGRSSWFKAHRYDPAYHRAEDRELLLRTRASSRFAGLPDVLYGYRVNRVSLRNNTLARLEYFRAVLSTSRGLSRWQRGVAAIAELGKLCVDTVALGTHTSDFLLQHRARPLRDSRLKARWQELWVKLHLEAKAS